jgi:uncharacterized membrane protein YphA (DoxX/SURF4 family)
MLISTPALSRPQDQLRTFGFRFVFCYLVLYIWPFPFQYIPFVFYALTPLHTFLSSFVDSFAGPALFGDAYTALHPTGSGDTSYCYTQSCLFLVAAFVACLIWTWLEHKRTSYKTLSILFDTTLRFYLAATLFTYGFIKVFPLQFQAPDAARLAQSYGESSPMGLLWTFMGSSKLYSFFTGMGEVTAGVLLLFRRTKLLGATLSAIVFLHVFVLNLAYDVPVKLFSLHLLLISMYVAAPIVRTFTGRPTPNDPALSELVWPTWNSKKARWIIIGAKCLLIFFIGIQPALASYQLYAESTQDAPSDTRGISGIYTVSSFSQNGEKTQTIGWKEVKFSNNLMEIVYTDGASIQWHCVVLQGTKKIRLASKDLSTFGEFDFTERDQELILTGKINDVPLAAHTRRTADYTIPLLNREFHWVTEEPFNR